jgi:poly-beta-1,6-N-acetyl-D-glucosamine N-deacetylase
VKRRLRKAAFAILRYSGFPWLLREVLQKRKVTIVVYHAPTHDRAREHFEILCARYNVIALTDYVRARREGTVRSLPPKSLVITLDDGHRTNFELKPILERLRLPITIFLCSGVVGTNRHFWWSHTRSTQEARNCKRMQDASRLQLLHERDYRPDQEYHDRQSLAEHEIAQLKHCVDFQAHTVTHPILPACADDEAERQIHECKKDLEQKHNLKIYALAYPNGDYSPRELDLVRKTGFDCAVTLDPGFNDAETDLLRLRRIPLPDDASINELLVKTSGLWDLLGLRSRVAN